MQSVSTRMWTRVAVSISYDDNHYSTGTPQDKILNNNNNDKKAIKEDEG